MSALIEAVLIMTDPSPMCGSAAFANIEHRGNVRRESFVPFLLGDVLNRVEAHLVRSVVDENIDPPERNYCLFNQGASDSQPRQYFLGPTGIHGDPLLQPGAFGLSGIFMLVEIRNNYICPFSSVGQSHGAPDTG